MRGNGWVGGLIRYIRRKDGHNAANTRQRCARDEGEQPSFAPFSARSGGKRVSSSRMDPHQGWRNHGCRWYMLLSFSGKCAAADSTPISVATCGQSCSLASPSDENLLRTHDYFPVLVFVGLSYVSSPFKSSIRLNLLGNDERGRSLERLQLIIISLDSQ